jgi:hypothetical protein
MKPLLLASTLIGVAVAVTVAAMRFAAPAPQPHRPEVEACDQSCKALGGEAGFLCLDRCSTAAVARPPLTLPVQR